MNDNSVRKRRLIKIGTVIACVLAVIILAYFILAWVLNYISEKPKYDFYFYEPDYKLDINDYPEYLEKNRDMDYTDEYGFTYGITEENLTKHGSLPVFFDSFFDAVKAGNADAYNSMFTDEYFENAEKKEKFTKQMIYDIKVEFLLSEEIDKNTNGIICSVLYKIYRNDGSFRDDIGSDMARRQEFTLYEDIKTGQIKINGINNIYKSYQ